MIEQTTVAPTAMQTASASSLSQLSQDYQSFLKLLTAQVANQDPLAPMDSSTFVTQLAQLSQVEQSVQVNANLREISARLAGAASISDVQLIGRNVTTPGNRVSATLDGVPFSYELAEPASEVTARIMGANGAVLRTLDGLSGLSGTAHDVVWDGRDDFGLPVVGDGPFRVEVSAVDDEGKTVPNATYVPATVESVVFRAGVPMLLLDNGTEVSSTRIMRVD
jgi:flagellar basal-body rod modification protein FlgD